MSNETQSPTTIAPELKCVAFGPDTFLVNFKFTNQDGTLNGASLPDAIQDQLDAWQKEARRLHEPVPTDLIFSYGVGDQTIAQTLYCRSHGAPMWSWLLYCDDMNLSFAPATVNKGLFCQARFSAHLLWSLGPHLAMTYAEILLRNFLGDDLFHKQCSEIHLCADIQGFDFSQLSLSGEHCPFVSRVTTISDRLSSPMEEEQQGGLSPLDIRKLEEKIANQQGDDEPEAAHLPRSLKTTHRRIATIDFGSHASMISAQIYNKTKEIKAHKKQWFDPIHKAGGADPEAEIWRLEFRVKRGFLRLHDDMDDARVVLSRLRELWEYATCQWLRMVDMDAPRGANISRIPTHPVWEVLQHAYDALPDGRHALDTNEERSLRLQHILEEKPLETLKQAVYQAACNDFDQDQRATVEQEETILTPAPLPAAPTLACVSLVVAFLVAQQQEHVLSRYRSYAQTQWNGVEVAFRDEPRTVQRDLALDQLAQLPSDQVTAIIDALSPSRYQDVQTGLVRRSRRMSKLQSCIAGGIGYIRSAIALMPPDELPGYLGPDVCAGRRQLDFLSSVLWFADQAAAYDAKKRRSHIVEVEKKKLSYSMVSAQDLADQQTRAGVILQEMDWNMLDDRYKHRAAPTDPAEDEIQNDGFFAERECA